MREAKLSLQEALVPSFPDEQTVKDTAGRCWMRS